MADSIDLNISLNGIQNKLSGMISRAGLVRGWLNRVGYPLIIEAQRLRWVSEGASEGKTWAALNPEYARYKLKKFADAPGGGRKMLVATGRLVDSVTGDNTKDHYKLVEETRLSAGSLVAYAKFVDEKRNFTILGDATIKNIADQLGEYIRNG